MKKSIITLLLAMSLMTVFAGCGNKTVDDMQSDVNSTIDSAEDKLENNSTNSGSYGNGTSSNNGTANNNSGNVNNNGTSDNVNGTSNTNTNLISKDEAKSIALKHAGVKEADIYDYDVDTENTNGVTKYDIDFETDSMEYDYDINAETGEIIKSSKDDKKDIDLLD